MASTGAVSIHSWETIPQGKEKIELLGLCRSTSTTGAPICNTVLQIGAPVHNHVAADNLCWGARGGTENIGRGRYRHDKNPQAVWPPCWMTDHCQKAKKSKTEITQVLERDFSSGGVYGIFPEVDGPKLWTSEKVWNGLFQSFEKFRGVYSLWRLSPPPRFGNYLAR